MLGIIGSILRIVEDVTFGSVILILLVAGAFFWYEYKNWGKK
jgi:hypothetical protein